MRNDCPSILCYGYIRGVNIRESNFLVEEGMMKSLHSGGRIPGYYHGPRVGFFSGLAQIVEAAGISMKEDIAYYTRMFAIADGLIPCDKSSAVRKYHNRVCIGTKTGRSADYHCAIMLEGEWWNKTGEDPAHLVIGNPETSGNVAGYGNVVFYDAPVSKPDVSEAGRVRTVFNPATAQELSAGLDHLVEKIECNRDIANFISPLDEADGDSAGNDFNSLIGNLLNFAERNHIPLGEKLGQYTPRTDSGQRKKLRARSQEELNI